MTMFGRDIKATRFEELTEEDKDHLFNCLELIRVSGICNMYGAAEPLSDLVGISEALAKKVLVYWMEHYAELAEKYQWFVQVDEKEIK